MERISSNGEVLLEDCILGRPHKFRYGQHIYDGAPVHAWGVMICKSCRAANWDGIVLDRHPRLVEHFKRNGIKYTLNASGWLDIPR